MHDFLYTEKNPNPDYEALGLAEMKNVVAVLCALGGQTEHDPEKKQYRVYYAGYTIGLDLARCHRDDSDSCGLLTLWDSFVFINYLSAEEVLDELKKRGELQ